MKIGSVLLGIFLTAVGIAGGYFSARQNSSDAGAEAHEDAKPKISPQLLKNLGVTLAEAEQTTFTRYKSIPAVVQENPDDARNVHAPVAGRIVEVRTRTGAIAGAGDVLVTLLRDPLPRVEMVLTAELLKPLNEEIHKAAADLRKAAHSAELLKAELERVRQFTNNADGAAVLPKKTEIDLRNELARAEKEIATAEDELERHGLSESQIAELKSGKHVNLSDNVIFRQTLEHNGLWPATAQSLLDALPEEQKRQKIAYVGIGELVASGRASTAIAQWLKATPAAAARFAEVAGLLQQNHTFANVRALFESGAFDEVVEIRAPIVQDVADWDVHDIPVRPGDRVEAGAKLIDLDNWRTPLLKCEAVGSDAAVLIAAVQNPQPAAAVPLIKDSAPKLDGLSIERITQLESAQGAVGFVRLKNKVIKEGSFGAFKFRTWDVRPGTKYVLRLPTETLKDAYVLPIDALTEEGPDKVVYIQDGESFKSAKVVVLYQDHESAVLDGKHSEIFPGDSIVQHGAFGLGLALRNPAGAEGGDDDDDHAHHHHHHHD